MFGGQNKYTLDEIQKMLDKDEGTLVFWAKPHQIKAAKAVLTTQGFISTRHPAAKALLRIYARLMDLQNKAKSQMVLGGTTGDGAKAYLIEFQRWIDEAKEADPW